MGKNTLSEDAEYVLGYRTGLGQRLFKSKDNPCSDRG